MYGKIGMENAKKMQALAAAHLAVDQENVAIASTGVIGKQLPMSVIETGINELDLQKAEPSAFHEAT